MGETALVWFRLDLRLSDNPALSAAAQSGYEILPVFIWAPEEEGDWPPGAASRWWLHHSLQSLDTELRRSGSSLILRKGPVLKSLQSLIRESGARAVFWNRRYEPVLRARDAHIQKTLQSEGLRVEIFNATLFFDPGEIKNKSGQPYRVFTPFWKACRPVGSHFFRDPLPVSWKRDSPESLLLDAFELEPRVDWAEGLRNYWQPGESGARKLLNDFTKTSLEAYIDRRDFPAPNGTSRLSPHLHFGEISPHRVKAACDRHRSDASREFLRQLGWREFAYHLLHHFPDTPHAPLRPQFGRFPWEKDPAGLKRWQQGRTGFPIVDAGMRQLWTTGWMHNRVRMIAGSFLVKDLMISWTEGSRWFWDTLVDADLANNTLGWQWVAGCGADAAPYFRIFNPLRQAEKYDPDNAYLKQWITELGTPLYPEPMVDHGEARKRALDALASIKP
ncbi:MAG: deoxyribodipyrimidine photo-lyase [Acidobacteriota bacterium]